MAELGAEEFERRLLVSLVKVSQEAEAASKRNATGRPKVRTGRLRASIRSGIYDKPGAPEVFLRAGGRDSDGQVAYAGLQEFGGTVKPKAADYLRIPLGPSLTPAGVERFGGSLRDYAGEGFYVFGGDRSPFPSTGSPLFIGKRGDEVAPGIPRAWYLLVKEVTVPRTLFLGRGLGEAVGKLEPALTDLFRVAVAFDREAVA